MPGRVSSPQRITNLRGLEFRVASGSHEVRKWVATYTMRTRYVQEEYKIRTRYVHLRHTIRTRCWYRTGWLATICRAAPPPDDIPRTPLNGGRGTDGTSTVQRHGLPFAAVVNEAAEKHDDPTHRALSDRPSRCGKQGQKMPRHRLCIFPD